MPMYDYKCGKCGQECVIIRTFANHEEPPTKEESTGECEHEWTKLLVTGTTFVHGSNWTGRKGSW